MQTTELVKSVSVDNLVNQRNAVVAKMRQALETLQEAAKLAEAASLGFPDVGMNCRGGRDFEQRVTGDYRAPLDELVAKATNAIDARAWAYLMNESGLRTFMDATARREWDGKLAAREVPPLTVANVSATFSALHDARGELFDRGVINCFRGLSWDYKTNQPFKFGKRLVLRRLHQVYGAGKTRWLSTNFEMVNQLDDLDRVLHLLDGKPEPDHRHGWISRIRSQATGGEACGAYFAVRWFLNGNGHVTFARQDLVDQMNLILAKHFPLALASELRA
jgi:hypothetical protein